MMKSSANNKSKRLTPSTSEDLYLLTHPKGEKGEQITEQESFKISRNYLLQSSKVERNLFSELEEREESNDIVVTGLTKQVSELDLASLTVAIGKILHDQSHTARNEDSHTGVGAEEIILPKDKYGELNRGGVIFTTLIDLCRIAYGTKDPTSSQKKKMNTIIEIVHKTPVKITFPNGNEIDSYLCTIQNRAKLAKTGAVYFHLIINPIFCGEILKNNYGLFPHDATFRLSESIRRQKGAKKTPQHLWLMGYLSCQDASKPKSISLWNLLDRLGLTASYRKNKKRVEAQLSSLFFTMKDIGLLLEEPEIGTTKDGAIKYTFHINPKWSKTSSPSTLPSS